mmetsp:Transcript_35876/g.94013  ORF Transcript_35876/g.94013 Transcript_35876/m.94013 type:complete len:185 (+) Transcript_35876:214-768(+)|eukprot:CAMPEP_0182927946 /NCGR_PEP_ID=MMETSP0105_2-20130417/14782_1 /TAXON_ID=81532 ORGANISM="Acanthoeca-like sp., Strain 10tr" /NCGR_SAMPLE_ID=MMETSP0105_2 /ASSEMBLY_ACC=CAM_ASM_000205 /LENGTH=184 /DNA_ID=CAMNT_0025065927 /DNA_START=203 /DNA_END=757 /DNA_ORIENTATION=-
MGGLLAKAIQGLFANQEARLVMLGLDAAGKTTILYKLKLGEVVTTIPTIGFNVEQIEYKKLSMTVWDVGGQTRIRPLWRHYFLNTQGLIFVIDSNDRERIGEAKEELDSILTDATMADVSVCIYANKQDLPNAMPPGEIIDKLGLRSWPSRRDWYVQPACASTGDGLFDGLDWMANSIKAQKSR